MKTMLFSAALLLAAGFSTAFVFPASAQYIPGPVTTYYAPAGPVVAPVYTPQAVYPTNRTTYYAPAAVAPAAYYAPTPTYSTYYAPAAPVAVAPVYSPYTPYTPYVVGRPVVAGRSIYGTRQVYVPGQPVRNSLRAVTPY